MAHFDRFDIISAHYAYCADYHGGQDSWEYRCLSRISTYFTPGHSWNGYASLSDNGKAIYDNLVQRRQRI